MTQPRLVLEELKRSNVTHVVGLPDNASARLFELLEKERSIQLVPVTRGGEAFAVAAGLWIGGMIPVVPVQNTGFCESGDSFRGTVTRMRVPLVCLITCRGYRNLGGMKLDVGAEAPDADEVSSAHPDSAALITEPTLASGVGAAIFRFALLSSAFAHLFGSQGFAGGCIGGALPGFILGIIKPAGAAGGILPTAIACASLGPISALFMIFLLKLICPIQLPSPRRRWVEPLSPQGDWASPFQGSRPGLSCLAPSGLTRLSRQAPMPVRGLHV